MSVCRRRLRRGSRGCRRSSTGGRVQAGAGWIGFALGSSRCSGSSRTSRDGVVLLFLRRREDGTAAFRREQRVLGVLTRAPGRRQSSGDRRAHARAAADDRAGHRRRLLCDPRPDDRGRRRGARRARAVADVLHCRSPISGQAAASAELVGRPAVHEHTTDDARALEIVERAPVPRGGRALLRQLAPIPVTHRTHGAQRDRSCAALEQPRDRCCLRHRR